MNKKWKMILIIILFMITILFFCFKLNKNHNTKKEESLEINSQASSEVEEYQKKVTNKKGILNSPNDINLIDLNGKNKKFSFTYNNELYYASYSQDNWHIIDSYKITNYYDIIIICQALIDVHPIHGIDKESYRTAEDMADEWVQHNFAYYLLPENSSWREHAKNVDLDPEDQGKNLLEMYQKRKH